MTGGKQIRRKKVPPPWVPLRDAREWVKRARGVAITAMELILAVRDGELCNWYRIAGIKPRIGARGVPHLPPGLDYQQSLYGGIVDKDRIVISDSEAAEANWNDCTVGGWPQPAGVRERLLIEIAWKGLDQFVGLRLPRLKREAGGLPEISRAAPRIVVELRSGDTPPPVASSADADLPAAAEPRTQQSTPAPHQALEAPAPTPELADVNDPAPPTSVPNTSSEALKLYLERPDVPRGYKGRYAHYRELNEARVARKEPPWPKLSRSAFTTGRKRGNPGSQ